VGNPGVSKVGQCAPKTNGFSADGCQSIMRSKISGTSCECTFNVRCAVIRHRIVILRHQQCNLTDCTSRIIRRLMISLRVKRGYILDIERGDSESLKAGERNEFTIYPTEFGISTPWLCNLEAALCNATLVMICGIFCTTYMEEIEIKRDALVFIRILKCLFQQSPHLSLRLRPPCWL
jgi:hypothetical protein